MSICGGRDNLLLFVEAANILEQRRTSSSELGKTAYVHYDVTIELVNMGKNSMSRSHYLGS